MILFLVYCGVNGAGAVLMIIALLKIRSCFVDKGLGDRVSPLRMVVHALSFLIYIMTYMVLAVIN
jgi:hypothetical protein